MAKVILRKKIITKKKENIKKISLIVNILTFVESRLTLIE